MRRRARLAGLTGLALITLLSAGCSRSYWRRNADAEAYGLIREKAQLDARWTPPRSDIIPGPLSRLYDPADPDFGPLPPDDPAAHQYMRHMSDCQRIHGSSYWDEIGMGPTVENPAWVASLPIEGQPGPLLADAFERRNDAAKESSRPLPFLKRFAVTESLRSLKLPSFFDRGGSQAPGRATIETASISASAPTATASTNASVPQALIPPQATASADRPAAGPTKTKKGGITLASFEDEKGNENNENEGEIADPSLPPPATESDSGSTDPFGELPEVPADPESAMAAPTGPDITAANPALPEVEALTLEEAVRLSYLHGREYQTQLETVYLAALDLAFDRFQFDVRFLGIGGRPSSDLAYSGTPDGQQSLTATNRIGISRLLPAGGQWAVELANQTLWLFADGPDESGTASTLSFSFIQPLLFAAGRKVVLEDLTQSERNLLYAVRDLARFRQEFFVNTVSGGPSGGYLGLLQTIQNIANQEDNIRRLEDQLEITEADELRADPLSRTQLNSQLLSQLNNLRNARRQLQDRLDQFKIQLGLPPDLKVELDTKLLRPFQLIAGELILLEQAVDDEFFTVWATIDVDDPPAESMQRALAALEPLIDRVRDEAIPLVEQDLNEVERTMPQRLASLPEPKDENRARVEENWERDKSFFETALTEFTQRVAEFEAARSTLAVAETLEARRDVYEQIDGLQENLLRFVRNIQGIQVGLRTDLLKLNPFEMPLNEAVGYALTNRVDLMNQRALVTDARRKVEVAANTLRAVLDVNIEADIRTPTVLNNDNPFDFRRTSSNYRAGLRFVAPLDQIAQRNVYRVSQITYQRVRRNYMQFEDQVKFQVRQSWRQLAVLRENFEVARYALRVAAQEYDLAVESTADPGQSGSRGAGQAGQNLTRALNSVLRAQNDLIGIWVDYESTRLNIYADMGIMDIDARGLWVDPFYQNGLTLPEGNVDGPPGWTPSNGSDGPFRQNDDPSLIPPAPAPPAGVQMKGGAPSGVEPASKRTAHRSASPADHGVLTAAFDIPPSSQEREAGHARTSPPPLPRRRPGSADRNSADAAADERPSSGWRASTSRP